MVKEILYPIRRLHGILHEINVERKKVCALQKKILSMDSHVALYVLTPTHGNLGDHAIAIATVNMLSELGIDYVEITTKELNLLKKYRKLNCLNRHSIIVNGGGNIGTLWPKVEDMFRAIITENPDSKILCLPNTAFFENSESGKKEYEKSKKIYNSHSTLRIFARERISYELLKKIHKDIVLVPDMVLSINKSKDKQQRRGCLLCLRVDCERTRSAEDDKKIRKQAQLIFKDNVVDSDMNIGRSVTVEMREMELENKFNEFRSAELVITDRLHGMIFAAITGTPCIVLNSKSPKVKGCFEWIKHLNYIQFVDNVDQIIEIYKNIPKQDFEYDNSCLQKYFNELKKYILELSG